MNKMLRRVDRKFQKLFFKALANSLPQDKTKTAAMLKTLQHDAEHTFYTDELHYDDDATQGHHWAACLALTSDAALLALVPDMGTRHKLIETALLSPARQPVKVFTRLMLMFSLNRFKTMRRYARDRVPSQYGPHFQFDTLEDRETLFIQGISRCFFNSYFRTKGQPHLTHIFCEFDRLWIDVLKPERDGVAFDRPITLATGAHRCQFEFRRVRSDDS